MTPPLHPPGTVQRQDAGWSLRFERELAHPREKVWRALTESEHLAHWMPCDLVGERRAGATLSLPFWPAHVERYEMITPTLTGEIRVWDPPSVFEWTWDTDVLRWELAEVDGGTLLTFTTWVGPDDEGAARTAAGYHVCLDHLLALLDGVDVGPLIDGEVEPLEAQYGDAVRSAP